MTTPGGSGTYRGGLGQTIAFRVRSREPVMCSLLGDRTRDRRRAFTAAIRAREREILIDGTAPLNAKAEQTVAPGVLVEVRLPGGGGYGSAAERDPDLVAADLREGYVTS